ncbi:unnamed protein product, partial [Oppiella nova]
IGFTLLIGFIIHYLSQYIWAIKKYPPGPKPLPILGNILLFRNYKKHWNHKLIIWVGPWPCVIVCDLDIAKEAFSKVEFSGRPPSELGDIFTNDKHSEIAFADYGKTWEALRKVGHSAIRKFSKTSEMSQLVNDNVSEMLDLIKDREGIDKPFHAEPYLYNLVSNIHLAAMYSNKVKLSEAEMEKFKFVSYAFSSDLGDRIFRYEFVPYMKYFMANPFDTYRKYFAELHEFSANHFQRHTETYDKENRRNFCDLLIGAKHEAEANEKVSAQHLTDINMATTLLDIFLTSVDVTHMLLWIILLVAYYPDVQQKIRDEIRNELGDKPVTGDDRHKLHYTMAYVYEVFRYRNSAPIGFFHKTLKDCKLDTCVVVHQYSILMDNNYWDKPDEFTPGRFLDDQGKLIAVKPAAFIPFGYGRRVCIGEQMAYNNLFVTLVRLLQLTSHYTIEVDNKTASTIEVNPINVWIQSPPIA